ncbi:hypothetical protein N2152v2_011154 [Parachlorella kessleri]
MQQTLDLESCQQVYGGSVQSFAVNAHGGEAMVEIWIVDAQGQVYYDQLAQANRTAAPPSPLPVEAPLTSSPTPGTSLSPSTQAAVPPGPVGSAALNQHGNAVVVSFTLPADPGSSPIIDIVVTAVPATGTPGSPPNVTCTGSSSPVVLHGLQDQVSYTVHIWVKSAAGASTDVQVGPAFTYYMATPGAPSNLTVTATGIVTFTPTTAGASTIDGYRVYLVCANANGTSPALNPFVFTARTSPRAPTGFAVSSTGLVSFTTSPANSGASPVTKYIATALSSGGPPIVVQGSSSPLQLTGLQDGTLYAVTLVATNANGTSPVAGPLTLNAVLTPACPTDIAVSSTGLCSFTAPVSSGASPIIGYTLTAIPDNGGTAIVVQGTSSPLQVAGLQSGMGYTATLVASNANGDSPPAGPVAFTAPVLTPGPPTNVAVSSSGLVSFTNPINGGASPLSGYTVTAVPASGGAAITVQGSCSPLQLAGLQAGTSYTILLVATNANGDSPAAGPVAYTAPSLTPDPPADVAVSSSGLVTFAPPVNVGASAITGYTVTAVAGNGGAAISVQGSSSPLQLAGLQAGTSYTISLVATNANGDSPAAGPVAFVAPPAPDPPTNIAVTPAGLVTILATNVDGSSPASPPVAFIATLTPDPPTNVAADVTGCHNVYGTSPASNAATFVATGVPDEPTSISISSSPVGLVTFSAPADSGASPITGYIVRAIPSTNGAATITLQGSSSPLQLTGLVDRESYMITVVATNTYGNSPAAGPVAFTPAFAPGPPTNVAASTTGLVTIVTTNAQGNSQASSPVTFTAATPTLTPGPPTNIAASSTGLISFSAPASTGASPITGYTATAIPSNGGNPMSVQGNASPLQLGGLQNGASYSGTVVATNAQGNSQASSPFTFTASLVPGPPTLVTASPTGLISFTPGSPGASPITGYIVTAIAKNIIGNSAVSGAAAFTASLAPGPPANVIGFPNGTCVFTRPTSTGFTAITGYTITAMPAAGSLVGAVSATFTATSTATTKELGGLLQGASYTLSVTVQNTNGSSVPGVSPAFTYTGNGHGFLDSRIIYPPAHITGTTAGSSNVVAATLACSVGFSARRQSGTSTVLSEAIRGPQMFYAFQAAARIAYAMSDVSFIYPITPSTPGNELFDQWATEGRRNLHGNVMQVMEMESEAGVAGALHGALAAGALATTFTCSQGLLLMIPDMYKIAGELIPCVLHVTARALAGHALSIFGDHQDVMAVRQTGWSLLSSHSVQEAHDLALVAHLATLAGSVPIVHFFDGFRTSHEIDKISLIDEAAAQPLVRELGPAIAAHHARALNPAHPHQRGMSQGPDVYMQSLEAANTFHKAMPMVVQSAMDQVAAITGRQYHLFDYVGHPQAEHVVVAMGSGCAVLEAAVGQLVREGEKVGLVKVHLYRPWSAEHLLAALPPTVKRIAVLDRTKEHGSGGEPLLLDVAASLHRSGRHSDVLVVGGRYGLGSKDFTPAMALAVYENLGAHRRQDVKDGFTVGITDDVSFSSLLYGAEPQVLPESTMECLFWGLGSDGTVGANKEAVKIIASQEGMHAQAYFSYDAHKSGGVTVSHLRFGPDPISAPYLVHRAHYLGVHQAHYLAKYDVLSGLRPGGVLLVNAPWRSLEELEQHLSPKARTHMAALRPQVYTLDAAAVAQEVGLGRRINMVMQAAFFALSGVMEMDKAIPLLKESIKKAYGKKGEGIVAMNYAAVDKAVKHLVKIEIPEGWGKQEEKPVRVGAAESAAIFTGARTPAQFIDRVVQPMLALEGDKLPVSVFTPGGYMPPGTTAVERRTIASRVPAWNSDNCTQCNICSFICPHAAIRPALVLPEELGTAPEGFSTVPIRGGGKALKGYQFRIQVSPHDCTGCELCAHACPDNALAMTPLERMLSPQETNWDFFRTLPNRGALFDKATIRGSQFQQPLMEFSGACEGCGETPYVKLLTQLFGTRMVVANATGCSSIWGGSCPANPYTIDQEGRGPAWANSLFEDNAQFGLGIAMGIKQRRAAVAEAAKEGAGSEALRTALQEWLPVKDVGPLAGPAGKAVAAALNALETTPTTPATSTTIGQGSGGPGDGGGEGVSEAGREAVRYLAANLDLLDKPSVWIVGGDGWAYDIGFGGLDHVLSTGEDVNVLVLDTEEYSNTGGQQSKASPMSAVVKFASGGKARQKKELGLMMMQAYPDVYTASVCLEANYNQVIKALSEAEAHPGPSLVVAYAPCAMHGITEGMKEAQRDARLAVDSGYWPLYRFQPGGEGKGRLSLDSKRLKGGLEEFLQHENRFAVLVRKDPEAAARLHHELEEHIHLRQERLVHMAEELRHAQEHAEQAQQAGQVAGQQEGSSGEQGKQG